MAYTAWVRQENDVLTLLVFVGLAATAQQPAVAEPRPPNVVFILADDLGVNDLGAYGRKEHRTPHLDRLAAEGLRFTTAYVASPICSPSRAAIMTGRAPARLHLTTYIPGRIDAPSQKLLHPPMRQQLPLEETTLAERLRAAGYATAAIGKWHLGAAGFTPREQGFDIYHPGQATTKPSDTEGGKGEYDLTREAERFIDANRDRPFFLYLAHNNPHIPYLSARPDLVEQNRGAFDPAYAATVQTLDDSVGRLLAHLDAAGLRDRTIVIFTSDNGGLHVPEGPHPRVTHNTPFRAGKGYVYEGGLRVPLIVRGPGLAARRVIDAPFVNTDWLPTLLDLVGAPAAQDLDGVNQASLLRTGKPSPLRTLFWHLPHYTNQGSRPAGAVRDGAWKLVEHYDSEDVELFNLETDAGEARNLAKAEPARMATLRQRLREWRRSVGAQENTPNPSVDLSLYRPLYVDFDPTRFDPLRADDSAWNGIAAWRERMNAAVKVKPPQTTQAGAGRRPNIVVAIADDWSYPHAGIYGDRTVRTPNFDRIASEGARFTHAFAAAPSCTPSRGALLTGQAVHRLEEGGNLWSSLPKSLDVYPDILERRGYVVGYMGKGWGPGRFEPGGRERNPAGPQFKSFDEFLQRRAAGAPFCFWFGSTDPHRPYEPGTGAKRGAPPGGVELPAFLPDTIEVRNDLLDYYYEVERFDRDLGALVDTLARTGELDNTIIIVTSDNGMPFPRAKANVYDGGVRVPLAIRWPGVAKAGTIVDALVSLADIAPTVLEGVGAEPPAAMTGRTLVPLLRGGSQDGRDRVFVERERHANVRRGDLSYPARAIRTRDYLYVRNFRPDRWPAGDPELYFAVGPFGDIDGGPSKTLLLDRRQDPAIAKYFDLATARRPAEELYDLRKDPHQIVNVAGRAEYREAQQRLRADLERWMRDTKDPRSAGDDDRWDRFPYYGQPAK
jgi:arylsulfatase A-like enzyme